MDDEVRLRQLRAIEERIKREHQEAKDSTDKAVEEPFNIPPLPKPPKTRPVDITPPGPPTPEPPTPQPLPKAARRVTKSVRHLVTPAEMKMRVATTYCGRKLSRGGKFLTINRDAVTCAECLKLMY